MKTHAVAIAALLLAACQAGTPRDRATATPASPDRPVATATPASPDRPASAPAADAPRDRPSDYVILGEATYRERIKSAPGARLEVELVDAAGSVLARTVVPDVAGPPMPFALPYDPARLRAGARHALRARLVGPDGEAWFATAAPVPVVPGEGTPVELLMRRSADDGAASPSG